MRKLGPVVAGDPTHSDGLANVDLEKEVEHSVRIAKIVMSHLTGRYRELFPMKEVPWYAPETRKCRNEQLPEIHSSSR